MKKTIILALIISLAFPAMAARNLKFMVSQDVGYDDNIYLKDKNKDSSMIMSTHVGADYRTYLPSTKLKLAATTNVGYNIYTKDPSSNNYWDALGQVQLSNDQIRIGDRFLFTSDPANNADTDRADRIKNNAYISYKTSTEKMFGIGFTLSDILDKYMKSDYNTLDRNRINAGAQLYYNVTSRTSIFAEYLFSNISYLEKGRNKSIADSYGSMFGLGITGDVASKVTGKAEVTYAMRDYRHDYQDAPNYVDLVGYFVSLEWQPTTQNAIILSGERNMEETRYANSRYFVDTTISLTGTQRIMDKVLASLTLTWDNMDYNNDSRLDNFFSIRPELSYQWRTWLNLGVWYSFRTRQSNVSGCDYDNNRAGIYARAVF